MERLTGLVRYGVAPSFGEGIHAEVATTSGGSLITSQGQPELTEMVRQGQSWYGKGVVTSVSLGQVLPTTLAVSTLWNGNAAGGKSYVLDGVGFWSDVSAGAVSWYQLYGMPSIVTSATAPATAEVGIIRGLRLGTTYAGNAKISQAVTVTDNGWLPLGNAVQATTTTALGMGNFTKLNGLFIIPPQYYFCLHVSGTNTTAEMGFFYVWHEVQLSLP
jgi:hypothetical protein